MHLKINNATAEVNRLVNNNNDNNEGTVGGLASFSTNAVKKQIIASGI